jgi:hypothetical protein
MKDRGQVLIRSAEPGRITFVTAHTRQPERYMMLRRNAKTWLLKNITPTDKIMGGVPIAKDKYKSLPADQVDQLFHEGMTVGEKIDGAGAFYVMTPKGVEVLSTRRSVTGRPIVHTERVNLKPSNVPPELVGTVLRGELYGEKQAMDENVSMAFLAKELGEEFAARWPQIRPYVYGPQQPQPEQKPSMLKEKVAMPVATQAPAPFKGPSSLGEAGATLGTLASPAAVAAGRRAPAPAGRQVMSTPIQRPAPRMITPPAGVFHSIRGVRG